MSIDININNRIYSEIILLKIYVIVMIKKTKILSSLVLMGLFVTSPLYSTTQHEMLRASSPEDYMYFKAEKDSHSLYFLPSHHSTPLSSLPQELQKDLETYERVTVESCSSIKIKEAEETPAINPLEPFPFLLSEDALREFGGYRAESDIWQINDQKLCAEFEAVFLLLGEKLPHLADYTLLKPAVALALFEVLESFEEHKGGMDDAICQIITDNNPQIPGSVETQVDVLNSLRVFERSYGSVAHNYEQRAEIRKSDQFLTNLRDVQIETERFSNVLLDETSMRIRNKSWVSQLNNWILKGKTLFVFGQAHFPGRFGLIRLMQENGWTWSHVLSGEKITPFEADMHFKSNEEEMFN